MKLAALISQAARPAITAPLGLSLVGFIAGGWPWAGASLLLAAGLPVGMVLILHATHALASMRVPKTRTRIVLLWVMVAMELAVLAIYTGLQAPPALISIHIAMTAGLASVALLTSYAKISVHCAVVAIMATAAVCTGGLIYMPLLALIPLIAWSRVTVKEHSLREVILGSVVPTITTATVATIMALFS